MRPTTKAGQELSRHGPAGLSWNELDDAIDAIEREAAAQERERIRAALKAHGEAEPWPLEYLYALEAMDAILAEPSE